MGFIKSLDNFGYTPQFRISGEDQYKTVTGGIIFICFAIFACWYILSEFIDFILRSHDVQTSRNIITRSEVYNITIKDLYFGIGLVDYSNNEFNLTQYFSYLKFSISKLYIDKTGFISYEQIQLAQCEIDYFISKSEYSEIDIYNINNKLPFYLCPPQDFNFKLSSTIFGDGEQSIQLQIDIANSSVLDYAKQNLFEVRPRLNFIYKNLLIDSENFDLPYGSYITSFYNEIDYEFSKKTDISMNPYEMLNNSYYFTGVKFQADISDYSSQPNNTVFEISRNTDTISYIADRTIHSLNQFNIYKFRIFLNPMMNKLLRSYPKFTAFLAGVTAILSNIFLILTIIMIPYNSIQGTNNMIKSMYTFESVKNMKDFNVDLKEVISKQISNLLKNVYFFYKKGQKRYNS